MLVFQGAHHLQASCWAAYHTAGRALLLTLLCALCCRVRTIQEPVTAFICEMLPEHMRETSRMELLYEDIEKLPVSEIARIAEWLTEKVDSLTTKTRAEPKEAEEEVGGAGRAALKVTWLPGPKNAGEVARSWPLLHDGGSGDLGHHDVQEGTGRSGWSWRCCHVSKPGGKRRHLLLETSTPRALCLSRAQEGCWVFSLLSGKVEGQLKRMER